jgi:recombinational DNA repair protein (RecF pathway)
LEEFCDEDSLNDNPVKTALMFIMRFAAIEGIFPILDKCCICGESDGQLNRFAMSDSGLCHKNCAPYSIAVNDKIITTLRHCAESEPIVEDDPTILKTFGLMRTYVKEQLGFAVKAEKALDDIL